MRIERVANIRGGKAQYIVVAAKKDGIQTRRLQRFIQAGFWKPVWSKKTTPKILGSKTLFHIGFHTRSLFQIPNRLPAKALSDEYTFSEYDTQCPPEVAHLLIKNLTRTGDVVLDPYCGSGTSLLEARKLGRNALGLDVSRGAVRITKERLSSQTFTKPL